MGGLLRRAVCLEGLTTIRDSLLCNGYSPLKQVSLKVHNKEI